MSKYHLIMSMLDKCELLKCFFSELFYFEGSDTFGSLLQN